MAYANDLGVDTRWVVISGTPDFFRLTKRLHHALHGEAGDGSELGEAEHKIYREVIADNAAELVKNGCLAVSEGANMPTTLEGVHVFKDAKILFAPGKAANAGGVAVSGLEMSQNSARISWSEDDLQAHLLNIMKGIHERCVEYGETPGDDPIDYVRGANIAGFVKVADAMLAFGVV